MCLITMKCKYCGKHSYAKNTIFCSKKCSVFYSTELESKNDLQHTRISITIEQDLLKNLRAIQSALIKNTNEGISLSKVVEIVLKEGVVIKKKTIQNA